METIEEKYNPLLNRREFTLSISEVNIPPSMDAARKMVAEKFSVPEEHVHVEKIKGRFGSNDFILSANIYGSPSEREKFHKIKPKKEAKAGR
ncbi:MAG TPA: hypothetical protein VMC07_01105 [Candidatus Omnitrophota bacterium]|nr:hypothetical protein [Candidatus Omnitrophota bacterium]